VTQRQILRQAPSLLSSSVVLDTIIRSLSTSARGKLWKACKTTERIRKLAFAVSIVPANCPFWGFCGIIILGGVANNKATEGYELAPVSPLQPLSRPQITANGASDVSSDYTVTTVDIVSSPACRSASRRCSRSFSSTIISTGNTQSHSSICW